MFGLEKKKHRGKILRKIAEECVFSVGQCELQLCLCIGGCFSWEKALNLKNNEDEDDDDVTSSG